MIQKIFKAKPKTEKELLQLKRELASKSGITHPGLSATPLKRGLLRNSEILEEYRKMLAAGKIKTDENLERLLRKRAVRTMSGIAPVAVLTKPFPCPGKCAFCPNEKNVPKSYLSNEPAVMRAIRNKYDPYEQVRTRLLTLENNGHRPEKIELIVIGGTWSVLPRAYKYWFIEECFRAANEFQIKKSPLESLPAGRQGVADRPGCVKVEILRKKLIVEQKRNEKAKYNIVGLTLETRPDYIDEKELIEMRELGCTRVEIGVQAVDDQVLKTNRRGHDVAEIARATALLKNFGFKVTFHLMPGLPGATAKKDLELFKKLFSDERFQPDQIKFYPTVVTRGSLLYKWWKDGKYRPYSDKVLRKLIIECKKIVPRYVRIIRLIRDIPSESIEAGNMVTNLRQVMQQQGIECNCIRCRECHDHTPGGNNLKLNIIKYPASGGTEYFISFDSRDGKILYGFCRLRLPKSSILDTNFKFLDNYALVRELHVYGELTPVKNSPLERGGRRPGCVKVKAVQHTGLGKRLLLEAEKIARRNDFKQIAVISGVGVRDYYRKNGYSLKNNYMIKGFKG